MRSRLLALAAVAVTLLAASAPAVACPGRRSAISPPAGGLIHDGEEITIAGPAARRLAGAGELRLWSTDHQIPLRVEDARRGRLHLVPTGTLAVGTQYHLVAASDDHPGWTAPLGVSSPWWTAAARDRRAELGTLAARLAAFGLLPFVLAFAATRIFIVRRQRRALRAL